MATHGVTTGEEVVLDAPAVAVIDAYLADLATSLPARAPLTPDVSAELRGDLIEAAAATAIGSSSTLAAARAAVAEFGEVDVVAAALHPELVARRARRIGIALLLSGPLVGACWLASLFLATTGAAPAWRWLPITIAPALLIAAPATALTVVTTGRLGRWLRVPAVAANTTVTVAGIAAAAGDILLLVGSCVLLLAPVPAPSPLVGFAAAVSLARLVLVARTGIRTLSGSRPFAST